MEYAVYREHIRRRRGWTWGPWSCVSAAALSFAHLLVQYNDFPSLYTSWTDRSILLSACTAHICIFCIAVLWLVLPKPFNTRINLIIANMIPVLALVSTPMLVEAVYDVPMLLAGPQAVGCGVVLFGGSTAGNCSKMAVAIFTIMYVFWLSQRIVPGNSHDRLEFLIPSIIISSVLLFCGSWLLLLDENVEYQCLLNEEREKALQTAIKVEVESLDDIVKGILPKFIFNDLVALRASRFPAQPPDKAIPVSPLVHCTADGALPMALTRLLGMQYDIRVARRCFVTVVVARECDTDMIFREGTLCQGGDAIPRCEKLFDSLDIIGSEHSLHHIMYDKGAFVACAGLKAAVGGNSEQMLSNKVLTVHEQREVASFALSAIEVAKKWSLEGSDSGLQLCVGISSGYISFGGVTKYPVCLNIIGLPLTEAVDLAMTNEPNEILITPSTTKLAKLATGGLTVPIQDMRVLNIRGRLTPIYVLKSGDCNASMHSSLVYSSSSTQGTDMASNSVHEGSGVSTSPTNSGDKLGKTVDGSSSSSNKHNDKVHNESTVNPASKNRTEEQKQRLGQNSRLGTRLLGLVLRRLAPNLQCDAGDLAVKDLKNHLIFPSNENLLNPWLFTPPTRPINLRQQMLQPLTEEVPEMHQRLVDNYVIGREMRIAIFILVTVGVALFWIFFPRGDDFRVAIHRGVAAVCCWIVFSMFHKAATWGKDKGGKMAQFSFLSAPEITFGLLAFFLLYLGVVDCNDSFLFSIMMALPWIIFVSPGYIWPHAMSLCLLLWGGLVVVWFLVLHLPVAPTATFTGTTLLSPSMTVMLRWLSLVPALALFVCTRLCIFSRCQDSLDIEHCEKLITKRLSQQMRETTHLILDMFSPRAWPLLVPHLPLPPPPLDEEMEMLESLPLAGAVAVVLQNTWVIYVDAVSLNKMEGILEPGDLSVVVQKVNHMLCVSMSQEGAYSVNHNNGSHIFIVPGISPCTDGKAENEEGQQKKNTLLLYIPESRFGAQEAKKLRIKGLETCIKALQAMEREITKFNHQYQLGLSVTVGLAVGDVRVGFIGGRRMSWDVLGEPVLQAWALSSYPLSDRDAPVIRMDPETMQLLQEMAEDPANDELLQYFSISQMDGTFKRNSPSMDLLLSKDVYHAFVSDPQYRLRRDPEVEDFQVLGLLGQGGSGKVYKAVDSCTGKTHAVKKLDNTTLFLGMSKWTRVELQILSRARHPNVVSFTGCLQSPQSLYLVMDYNEGVTLGALLRCQQKGRHFSIPTLRFWFGELAVALEYLHGLGIIHRDIKSDNIWISMDCHLQLMDFGLSKIISPDHDKVDWKEELPVLNEPTMRMLPEESHQLLKGIWTVDEEEEGKAKSMLDGSIISSESFFSPPRIPKDVPPSNNKEDIPEPSLVGGGDTTPSLCMLIVDPNCFHSLVKKTLIKQSGHTALIASGCRHARKVLFAERNLRINVLLVTWQQPGARKFLADSVSYMHAEGGITVVLSEKKEEKEANDSGLADYYFTEPFNIDHIRFLQNRHAMLPPEMTLGQTELSPAPTIGAPSSRPPLYEGKTQEELYFTHLVEQDRKNKNGLGNHNGSASDLSSLSVDKLKTPSQKRNMARSHLVGTLHMIAPEVISDQIYSFAVDWWNYGVCLYESATGLLPFVGNSLSEVYKNATKGPPNLTLVPDSTLRKFIALLLQVDPSTRLGSGNNGDQDVKRHAFFAGVNLDTLNGQSGPIDDPTVNLEIALAHSASSYNEDDHIDFYPHGRLPVADKFPEPSMSPISSSTTNGTSSANASFDIFEGTAQNVSICSADTVTQQVLLD